MSPKHSHLPRLAETAAPQLLISGSTAITTAGGWLSFEPGLGHCSGVPRKIWRDHFDLAECLRSCEVAGQSNCSYVSYLDDSLLRASVKVGDQVGADAALLKGHADATASAATNTGFSGGSLCLHFAQCEVLKSTLSGSATFLREISKDSQGQGWPENYEDSVTISTARSVSSRSIWQLRKQLCVGRSSVVLKDLCADVWTVKFVSGPVPRVFGTNATARVRVTIQRGKGFLCENATGIIGAPDTSNVLWLSQSCEANCFWDIVRSGENLATSEPCVWLRAAHDSHFKKGLYLSVSETNNQAKITFLPWSHDMSASCWNFGYEQAWTHDYFLRGEDIFFEDVSGKTSSNVQVMEMKEVKKVPHVWLLASPSYTAMVQRLLSRFHRAGETVRVSVRWVSNMRDTSRGGFQYIGPMTPVRRCHAFNYRKQLLLFEAYLDAVQSQDSMVIVMDLDVQVRRGWTNTLGKCLEQAEICFTQQMGFGTKWQQANLGIIVFKPTAAVGAFYHAQAARLQGQEILTRLLPSHKSMAVDQLLTNYMLHQILGLVKFILSQGSHLTTLRWGLYNPHVAHTGMFLTQSLLTGTVHHATSSSAKHREKLSFMDASEQLTTDMYEWCPLSPDGVQEIIGPLLAFCYFFTGVDPHFGPLLDHYRVLGHFTSLDVWTLRPHLKNRGEGRPYMHFLESFATNFRYYKAKRRNSSWYLGGQLLWSPSF